MADIIFEDLPPAGRTSVQETRAAAQALREHPGQWARVRTFAGSAGSRKYAYAIKHGVPAAWRPAGAFDATARAVDGEFRVYARYVGAGE